MMSISGTDELNPAYVAKWLETASHYLLRDRERATNAARSLQVGEDGLRNQARLEKRVQNLTNEGLCTGP